MNDPATTITASFAAHMEDISTLAITITDALAETSEVMVHALLSDKKVLCAGSGRFCALAGIFASQLVTHYERERPGLPAVALSADSCLLNAISDSSQYAESLARQVSTLGSPGDILFLLAGTTKDAEPLVRAVRAAHEREMTVILCHGANQQDALSLLGAQDVELSMPFASPARLMESYLLLINCLCELIDQFLFGGEA
jgi:D-sedoheptulose 7-phosphate isomerase